MDPRLFIRLLEADDRVAAAGREAARLAWPDRPDRSDAAPLRDDPHVHDRERSAIVRMLTRTVALLGTLARDS